MTVRLPLPRGRTVDVAPGPALLAGLDEGPGLVAHAARHGLLPSLSARHLSALAETGGLRGRGGAGFPFARKLATTAEARGRAVVVVNLSEGEPASLKDAVLFRVAPHLVLDGAALVAQALRTRDVHLVMPGDQPATVVALHRALAERGSGSERAERITWTVHEAQPRFVAGQAASVLELMAGRPNLPVTTWRPAAERGHRNRPTLLSNAETYAHVARLVLSTQSGEAWEADPCDAGLDESGTTLLTLDGDAPVARVREVRLGTPWHEVLSHEELASPVLLGGYHGTWASPGDLRGRLVARSDLAAHDLTLGAGVVLPLTTGCPVDRTRRLVAYLARESAGRCGPCFNGLPALAGAMEEVHSPVLRTHADARAEVLRLASMVERRGACAHPDGTVRLVRSMLAAFPDEVEAHAVGQCRFAEARERVDA